ncbi:argininosuccinate synthase [Akkermansiaceae bacterium]|nr:argininosuccinate synthase [Akkermansiaceae bacterium]MDB4416759.1 argininosuccinate synthase [bacterium]MDB4271736.1 argininosuccinate synthase [Akkermansiaceae bacterium]MDB4273491.1 argininosuccinate synthase [Akkermansiaceae bacterium]MDB4356511.1 argininosuccinate synthase [Akkermansiaceae bacterium]
MKIVVAYSGGLDTSVLLLWLKEKYNAEIIAYCADVGQAEELDGLEAKALATGASKCYIGDLKEEFAADYIFPMFQANAVYEGRYLLGTSIARPCIIKGMLDVAIAEGADAIAHGATGKGNDQVRFELALNALAPDIKMIAPWRDDSFREEFPGRNEMIEYCEKHGIDVTASKKKPYSMDRNLLHISFEAGALEDTWYDGSTDADKDMYMLSVSPEDAPDTPEYLQALFEKGEIIGLKNDNLAGYISELGDFEVKGEQDGYTLLTPYGVMRVLNHLGGKHGIGRVDIVENRFVGMKSRGIYETPGGTILLAAHQDLETLTIDRDAQHLRDSLIPAYAKLVYNGFWFAPERNALQALVTETQKTVNGEVRMKLYKGNIINAGRRSPNSLYDEDIATMEGGQEEAYNQNDATGFIALNGLRLKQFARVNKL